MTVADFKNLLQLPEKLAAEFFDLMEVNCGSIFENHALSQPPGYVVAHSYQVRYIAEREQGDVICKELFNQGEIEHRQSDCEIYCFAFPYFQTGSDASINFLATLIEAGRHHWIF